MQDGNDKARVNSVHGRAGGISQRGKQDDKAMNQGMEQATSQSMERAESRQTDRNLPFR